MILVLYQCDMSVISYFKVRIRYLDAPTKIAMDDEVKRAKMDA